jgi:hypothetical protein
VSPCAAGRLLLAAPLTAVVLFLGEPERILLASSVDHDAVSEAR